MTRKPRPDARQLDLFVAYLTAAPKSGPRSSAVLPGFQETAAHNPAARPAQSCGMTAPRSGR